MTGTASAYIGPGAGFGIVTSFLVFLNAIFVSLLSALLWPVNMVRRIIRRSRRELRASCGRVVILGLDGFSPEIAEELMEQELLSNLGHLSKSGTFTRLATTCPGISPVAWSSFQTGVNPGKHGIFDFLSPDRERYIPVLSSVKTGTSRTRTGVWPFRKLRDRPYVRLLRKSRPFWEHLGRYGLRSVVLRVPITYPPESLDGHLLSGMCVPDLRGTQGSYTVFSRHGSPGSVTGGVRCVLRHEEEGIWSSELPGPENGEGDTAALPLTLRSVQDGYMLSIGDGQVLLQPGVLSEWVELTFRSGRSKIRGISCFCVTVQGEDDTPSLYSTALHVSPYHPSVPISHPVTYSRYLSGLYGSFATLGLAEDTWALSNGAVSREVFLQQAWSIFRERRTMFFDALERNKQGLVCCVFDTSDRIQHMFWGDEHGEGTSIREMYLEMDKLIGETLSRMGRKDMLIVMSDHGFTSFHTCVDLNRWLLEEGYLVLEDGVNRVETSFRGVDWSETRAWSMGLAGIMLNLRGREGMGIVEPGDEAGRLLDEISGKLMKLHDEENGCDVISSVYRADEVYSGPYISRSPDLVVGMHRGYRSGWGCVTGGVGEKVLYPNIKHWNGDHCHDHSLVPGTLASNFQLNAEKADILDIAPTALHALGIRAPAYMEGRSLIRKDDGER